MASSISTIDRPRASATPVVAGEVVPAIAGADERAHGAGDVFALGATRQPSATAACTSDVSTQVRAALDEVAALSGLPVGAKVGNRLASARRTQAFVEACAAATTVGDVCAVVGRLAASGDDTRNLLRSNDVAALLVRVRDHIPVLTRRGLVAQLESMAAMTRAALPLLVALAPENYARIGESLHADENLTHRRSDLLTPNLTTALTALPDAFFEKARQLMLAQISAHGSAPKHSPEDCRRRSNEALLTRMAQRRLLQLVQTLDGIPVDEVCKRIDAFHDSLYAGLGDGRGNPGFRCVVATARAVHRHLPDVFAPADSAFMGASFTNAKWRPASSDIDIAFARDTARKVIEQCPRIDKKWALETSAVATWLRAAEACAQTIVGTNRAEGELLSLALQQAGDGTLIPTGPELLAATPMAIRICRAGVFLHVFDSDDPTGPPIYTRPL